MMMMNKMIILVLPSQPRPNLLVTNLLFKEVVISEKALMAKIVNMCC